MKPNLHIILNFDQPSGDYSRWLEQSFSSHDLFITIDKWDFKHYESCESVVLFAPFSSTRDVQSICDLPPTAYKSVQAIIFDRKSLQDLQGLQKFAKQNGVTGWVFGFETNDIEAETWSDRLVFATRTPLDLALIQEKLVDQSYFSSYITEVHL